MGKWLTALGYSLLGSGPTAKKVKDAYLLAEIQEQNKLLKKLVNKKKK